MIVAIVQIEIEPEDDDLLLEFIQVMRDYEQRHPGDQATLRIAVRAEPRDLSTERIEAIYSRVKPPFKHVTKVPKGRNGA